MGIETATRSAFTDGLGRQWLLKVNIRTVRVVREHLGIDLETFMESGETMADLMFKNRDTFCQILWIMCERQAKDKNIEPEVFAEGLDGQAINAATSAFLQAVVDFSPRPQMAQAIREAWAMYETEADKQAAGIVQGRTETALNTLRMKLQELQGPK